MMRWLNLHFVRVRNYAFCLHTVPHISCTSSVQKRRGIFNLSQVGANHCLNVDVPHSLGNLVNVPRMSDITQYISDLTANRLYYDDMTDILKLAIRSKFAKIPGNATWGLWCINILIPSEPTCFVKITVPRSQSVFLQVVYFKSKFCWCSSIICNTFIEATAPRWHRMAVALVWFFAFPLLYYIMRTPSSLSPPQLLCNDGKQSTKRGAYLWNRDNQPTELLQKV